MMRRSGENNRFSFSQWNRALSIRSSNRSSASSSAASTASSSRRPFSLSSLRGTMQPDLSKRLFRLIKTGNCLISAHGSAAKERLSMATQLSEWGEATGDEAVSDVADKLGVLLAEMAGYEDGYAHALDDARATLKTVRNTEKSVQPSRDGRDRIANGIAKLKAKEPESTKLVVLEQELVRAEADNLVAEAQLTNITRQKLKEAYQHEFLATIERAEKQAILARHGLRLLRLLDDTPVVPGNGRPLYRHASQARQVLNDAEDDLRDWSLPGDLLAGEDGGAKFASDGATTPTQAQPQGQRSRGQKSPDRQSRVGEGGRGRPAETGA